MVRIVVKPLRMRPPWQSTAHVKLMSQLDNFRGLIFWPVKEKLTGLVFSKVIREQGILK